MMRRIGLVLVLGIMPMSAGARDLSRFFAQVQTLKARFTQVVRDRHGALVSRGQGRLWLKRPGQFRWDYKTPYHEQIVGYGSGVWIYDPGLAQATRYSLNQALGRTPALLLAGRGHLSRLFIVQHLPTRQGLTWIKLKPRSRGQGFRWIRIGYKAVRIERIVLRDALDQTTTIHLRDSRLNTALPATLFRFQPPPHTAIVRE